MWIFCFFDLPVSDKKSQKIAAKFRKDLIADGFTMMQFSVYIRHCQSQENSEVHIKRIKNLVPHRGKVSFINITDKQYGNIINLWGMVKEIPKQTPKQLEFF